MDNNDVIAEMTTEQRDTYRQEKNGSTGEDAEQWDALCQLLDMSPTPKETVRPRGTDSAKVIQVIETRALEGNRTLTDPCRIQVKYWSLDGELLAIGNR